MPPVTLGRGCLQVGSERLPLYAGEFHSWRTSPHRWETILDRYEQLGLNVVATYIPWQYHELEPGRFDFAGQTEPQRNLVGFLELLHRRGFWVFIRPGPYIYAEWTNAGVPDRVSTLPRLSEAYRSEARVWMGAVTEAIRPFFATQHDRGRIVVFQPDNEMDLFSHWFEEPCGTGPGGRAGIEDGGFFQKFLEEAYGEVGALNHAWGTRYAAFDQATAHAARTDPRDPHALTRHKDYWRFQHWATREALRWHVQEYRRLGVDLPMVANYYPGGDVQNWREVSPPRSGVDFLGIDWYPKNEFGAAGERAALHRTFLDSCRLQRAYSPIPFIAEFEAGYWHGWHDHAGVLSPNHYRLMATSAFMAGIQGFNWYMLVDRDNWCFSPINERGELRPELGEVFMGVHRVARAADLPALAKLTDTAVCLDPTHIGTDNALADTPVLAAMHEADADFEFFDPQVDGGGLAAGGEGGQGPKRLMFYASADWLPRDAQARLLEYVERGGTLVLFRQHPVRDERFQPHDALGVRPPDTVLSHLGKKVELELGEHRPVVEGGVWTWDDPSRWGAEPIWGTQVAGKQQAVECADVWMRNYIGMRWICGYREPRGKGGLVVIGLPINADLVRAVHRWLGVPLHAQAALPGVKTALFRRASGGGGHVLFAANLADADVQCRVTLDGLASPHAEATDLWSSERTPVASDATGRASLVLTLARRSGGAWSI